MNAYIENTVQITKNISIPVTYNVNIGVGRMKKEQANEAVLEASNQSAFRLLIKIGIYKSLYSKGVISQTQLVKLIESQKRSNGVCR